MQKLRTDSPDLWQTAEHLAEMLRNDRSGELRNDPKLVAELGDILQQRITRGGFDPDSINLRVYLSSALGRFTHPPACRRCHGRHDPAPSGRAAGPPHPLDAIGTLIENVRAGVGSGQEAGGRLGADNSPTVNRQPTTDNSPFADPAFLDTLEKLSHDGEPVIRLRAAYVLGLVGGEKSLDRLAHRAL